MTPAIRMCRLIMKVTLAIWGVHGMRIQVPAGLKPSA